MKYDRIFAMAAWVAIGLFICFDTLAFGDEQTDWVVRTVASVMHTDSVDVMTGPDGEIIVGYNSLYLGSSAGDVTVARLAAGSDMFQYHSEQVGWAYASCAADSFGNVFYTANDNSGQGIRAGQDFGGFGELLSSYIPGSSTALASAAPAIGVNPSGMPVVAYIDDTGSRIITTFNSISEQWEPKSLAGLGQDITSSQAGPNYHSLTFDASGNPVLSYVHWEDSQYMGGPLVVAVKQNATWVNVALNEQAFVWSGTSVAADANGSVGFAYVDEDARLSYNTYGDELGTQEILAFNAWNLCLSPNSLAYDADGNPACVYGIGASTPLPLHLMRRNGLGQWVDEALPVLARYGSLTFDQAGNPLIAAFTYASPTGGPDIVLLSKAVPEPGSLLLAIMAAVVLGGYVRFRRRG